MLTEPPDGIKVLHPGDGLPIGTMTVLKAGAADGSGDLTLMERAFEPGAGSPLHLHHDADEAWYILAGELTYFSGDWSASVTSGSFVLVTRGTPHRYTVTSDQPARFLELFTTGGKERFFQEVVARAVELDGQRMPYDEARSRYHDHNMTLLADPW